MSSNFASALLIDYEYCAGCCKCELACIVAHGNDPDKNGIRVQKLGPWTKPDESLQYDFVPIPTDWCNLCDAVALEGELPACVDACPSRCITFGSIETLTHYAELKPKMLLFTV